MPECSYCGTAFDDDETYLEHLGAEHYDELGAIDRRRVDTHADDSATGRPTGPVVLGLVLVLAVAVVAAALLYSGGGSQADGQAQQPSDIGSVHYHGTIAVVIDGERVDFSQDQYQLQADAFHFEGGDGTRWHAHARGVTLAYAMETLGIDVTDSSVTYRGTTYRDGDPNTTVSITVNGQSVAPSDHVLRDGDEIRIVVEQS